MAKDLAREVGYIYIDSGAMYRAVTLYSIENGIFNGDVIDTERLKKEIKDIHISFRLNKETGRPDTYLNGVNVENKIRSMEVSSKVSPISTLDFVREAMVAQQQAMGNEKGIVMDGRDIGTTVFPDAELKIFVTATPEIRAQRRYDELKAKLAEIGFNIVQEVGLVTSVREMDEFYSKQPPALKDFYERMKSYVPSAFLTAFMAIPFPREAKELLFIVQKPKGEENA